MDTEQALARPTERSRSYRRGQKPNRITSADHGADIAPVMDGLAAIAEEDPPDPIPNSAVKASSADGTSS